MQKHNTQFDEGTEMMKAIGAAAVATAFGGGAMSFLTNVLGNRAEVASVGLVGLGLLVCSQLLADKKLSGITAGASQGAVVR